MLQPVLHDEFAQFVEEAYHETNRWLIQRRVLPEVDLRPFIRRSRQLGLGCGSVARPACTALSGGRTPSAATAAWVSARKPA